MTSELTYLTAITLFTALIWIPKILHVVTSRGIKDAFGYPQEPAALAAWANRVDRAHVNAVENLAVFAPLVLVAHAASISNEITVLACLVYLWARVLHFFLLTFAVPVLKSVAFMVGFGCQVAIAWQILSYG